MANDGSYDTARRHLGESLHTIQKFFAHSNWVELNRGNPNAILPNLVFDPFFPNVLAGPTDDTCASNGGLITTLLTSGYFELYTDVTLIIFPLTTMAALMPFEIF